MAQMFLLAFIPLFVAVDPPGMLPIYIGITAGQTPQQRRQTLKLVLLVAAGLALAFFAFGNWLLRFLNVWPEDFRVAGGILLLLIAVREIFNPKASGMGRDQSNGVEHEPPLVPLAMPLIVGPAVLTTGLALTGVVGFWITAVAFLTVMAILGGLLLISHWLVLHIRAGIWAVLSKIISILLAAIGVAFIRQGLEDMLARGVLSPG